MKGVLGEKKGKPLKLQGQWRFWASRAKQNTNRQQQNQNKKASVWRATARTSTTPTTARATTRTITRTTKQSINNNTSITTRRDEQ